MKLEWSFKRSFIDKYDSELLKQKHTVIEGSWFEAKVNNKLQTVIIQKVALNMQLCQFENKSYPNSFHQSVELQRVSKCQDPHICK